MNQSGQNPKTVAYYDGFQYNIPAGGTPELDFIFHAEDTVEVTIDGGTTNFNYVYHHTDHLGNIRLRYGVDPDRALKKHPVDVFSEGARRRCWRQVKILEESHYYPFGLKHQGYTAEQRTFKFDASVSDIILTPVDPFLGDSFKYGYGGKERQEELGLDWQDFGARNYDAALGRWMNIDPLAEEFASWTPYHYVHNNPINMIDPTGMSAEWVPTVSNSGEVSYVAEAGDSAETFSSQFGITQDKAEAIIMGSIGNTEIEEGAAISGETVAQHNGGNQILKLDLNSEMATEQRVFDQFVFANDVTKAYGGTEFHPADFYTNRFSRSVDTWGGLGSVNGTAYLDVDGGRLELKYQLELYSSSPYADRNGFSIDAEANNFGGTTGDMFPGNTGILKYKRVTLGGKAVRSGNKLFIQDNKSMQYMRRLNKTFSVDRSKQIKF